MLGLVELENWDDLDQLEHLAKSQRNGDGENNENSGAALSELGSVANMLESLVDPLIQNPSGTMTHIGHIIHVINAAQRAGIIVNPTNEDQAQGNRSTSSMSHQSSNTNERTDGAYPRAGQNTSDHSTGVAELNIFNQVLLRRIQVDATGQEINRQFRISTPKEAANYLQFNAMLLAPYQVEVLFVLCTLLGGRRKIDAQRLFKKVDLMPALNDMYQRLSFGVPPNQDDFGQTNGGLHGPGCECNPESALRVQYLRLVHNFCDRDCDNYDGRQSLLSHAEKKYISSSNWDTFSADQADDRSKFIKVENFGLLSKIIHSFINEEEDSPYKFWLASCIESFLRGSSDREQIFTANSGLLSHLVTNILSGRIHCAGSLQTSFDLLGERFISKKKIH